MSGIRRVTSGIAHRVSTAAPAPAPRVAETDPHAAGADGHPHGHGAADGHQDTAAARRAAAKRPLPRPRRPTTSKTARPRRGKAAAPQSDDDDGSGLGESDVGDEFAVARLGNSIPDEGGGSGGGHGAGGGGRRGTGEHGKNGELSGEGGRSREDSAALRGSGAADDSVGSAGLSKPGLPAIRAGARERLATERYKRAIQQLFGRNAAAGATCEKHRRLLEAWLEAGGAPPAERGLAGARDWLVQAFPRGCVDPRWAAFLPMIALNMQYRRTASQRQEAIARSKAMGKGHP